MFTCPKCGSPDCKRLETMYEERKIAGYEHSIGDEKLNPPKRPSSPGGMAAFLGIIFGLGAIVFGNWKEGLTLLGVGVGFGFLLMFAEGSSQKDYVEKHAKWLKQWRCSKCGEIWIPESDAKA